MICRYTLTHFEEEQALPDGEHVRFADVEPLLAELAELRARVTALERGEMVVTPGAPRSTDICVVWA